MAPLEPGDFAVTLDGVHASVLPRRLVHVLECVEGERYDVEEVPRSQGLRMLGVPAEALRRVPSPALARMRALCEEEEDLDFVLRCLL